MKKKSRFLTGLLSAVMALSLCAMPVMAEETTAVANTDAWGENTASITIHKYEYNGDATTPATGAVLDESEIPDGAKLLEGVTFDIYKVQDREALANYYSGVATDGVDYSKFTDVSKYYNSENGTVTNGKGVEITEATQNATTDNNGKAVFNITTEDLGLYLVVESNAPDKVTQKTPAFLVSVPMKDPANQAWLYDIHVYPKNSTTYGKVSIVKKGITGGDDAVNLQGVTFKLEKLTGENTWTVVTGPEDGGTDFDLTTDDNGNITISGLSQGKYRFVEVSGNGQGYILSEEPIEFEIKADGKTYYKNVEKTDAIVVENYRPDVDKKVYNEEVTGEDKYVEGADYNVGDMVPYQITVKVPKNITKLATFTVTDTPVGLEDKVNTIAIKCDGKDVKAEAYDAVSNADTKGFTITFDTSKMEEYAGQTIVITYQAEVLDSAVKTTEGNKNTAKLEYTNKINSDGKPSTDDNDKNTITDETVVYTFAIRIKKVDGANNEALSGARFDLYKEVTAGTEGAITDNEAKAVGLDGTKYWLKVESGLTSGSDGLVTTNKGLANGTYYLVETEAPEGYNLLAKPVEVKLDIAYKYTWTETNTYKNGNLVKHETSQKAEKFDPAEGGSVIGSQKGDTVDETTTGVNEITVINRKGFDLPVTGGFGTLLFSAIGVLLVVGGVGVLMSTKKKKGNA